jgi:hypothetical protein
MTGLLALHRELIFDLMPLTFSFGAMSQSSNYFNSKCIIHSLKPKKSSGCDEIKSKILKACASLISHPLSYIYYHSLYTGIFPNCLKIAVVKPHYKNGDKTSMTNYRPISLITVFNIVLKKAIHSRLSQHLHRTNILITEQYNFRKVISIEDAAFQLTYGVFKSIKKKCMLEEFFVIWQRLLIV